MVNLGELKPPPARMSPKDVLEIRTIAIRLAGMSVTAGQAGLWNASTYLAGHASVLLDFAACAVRLTVRHALVAGMSQLIASSRKRDDSLTGTEKEAKLLVRRAVEIVESYLDAEPLCCAT